MWRHPRLASILMIGWWLSGCTKSCAQKQPSPEPQAAETPPDEPERAATPSAPEPLNDYALAIRSGDYRRAAELLDQTHLEDPPGSEIKYARAWVAVQLGEAGEALRLLERLDDPLLAPEIEALRLEAAKLSRDVTLLGHLLGSPSAAQNTEELRDHLLLVEAERDNGTPGQALERVDKLLKVLSARKRRSDDVISLAADARLLRAELLERLERPAEAVTDYRWLALEAPTEPASEAAAQNVARLTPKHPLTSSQRLQRAEAFSDEGWPERTAEELDEARQAPGPKVTPSRAAELLAWAVYASRTDYQQAAALFQSAAKAGGDKRKNGYYAAKSLARAHQHDQAIAGYQAVAKLGGSYADHAKYQAARLLYIDGKWQEAIGAYRAYQASYSRGAHRSEVTYELAISRLAAGEGGAAYRDLSALYEKETSDRERARLLELIGVAYLLLEKPEDAKHTFERVIETRPLSLPALLAAARLRQMGETPPALIEPATGGAPPPALELSLPEKVARLQRVGLDHQAEQVLQAQESRIKSRYSTRSAEALCGLFDQLQSGRRQYQIAQWAASWSSLSRAPGPGTDWQWHCIYPRPYPEVVERASRRYDVEEAFVYAVMRQESAFRPRVVSPAKAVGLMQIIPPTARRIAAAIGTTYDPERMNMPGVNVTFGAYYLRLLLDMFGGRHVLAAASYNAGPQAVSSWLAGGETLPLDVFVARIPYGETRNYVYRVLGNYARYAYMAGESERIRIDLELPQGLRAPADAY